jgi:hypothetical protein
MLVGLHFYRTSSISIITSLPSIVSTPELRADRICWYFNVPRLSGFQLLLKSGER